MTRKQLLLMAIGCILPMIALAAIFLFQIQISTLLLLGLFLLCPALHLWMMRGHAGKSAHPPDQTSLKVQPGSAPNQHPLSSRE